MISKCQRVSGERAVWAGSLFWLSLSLLVASACSDEGTTTKCEDMPVTDDQEVLQAWWDQAVEDGCATAEHQPE